MRKFSRLFFWICFYFLRPIDQERQVRVYFAVVGNFRNRKNNSDPYLTKISISISGDILLEQYQYLALEQQNLSPFWDFVAKLSYFLRYCQVWQQNQQKTSNFVSPEQYQYQY